MFFYLMSKHLINEFNEADFQCLVENLKKYINFYVVSDKTEIDK